MKNQECYDKDGNFLGWFSRSVAVVGIPLLVEDNKLYVLASQRGPGTPDPEYRGMWNLTCGYLDFDETTEQAMLRELKEECGVDAKYEYMQLISMNSDPTNDKRQNVSLRYIILLTKEKSFYEQQFSHDGNEKDEVGEIKFIDTEHLDDYQWAFNHRDIIDATIAKHNLMMFMERYGKNFN